MYETSASNAKTSMSVPEMSRLLGLSKVEGYWLVNKGKFKTIVAAGKMRIMLDSFEEWYAGQFHYKKVTGEPPGGKWTATTMSIPETAELLGICDCCIYELIKKDHFKVLQIDHRTRVDRASFEAWYHSQSYYRTVADRQLDEEQYKDTLTLPEIRKLLGVHRNTVYALVQSGKLEVIDTGRLKRVPKASFERWYQSQTRYKKIGGDDDGIHR